MASTPGSNSVWKWISGILAAALMSGGLAVWMLGADAIPPQDFRDLRNDVRTLMVQQAETATALDGLRDSLNLRNTP